jgi:hypothetical protein
MSAGSNDRSLRLLPKAVLDHPNSLVLFGWTNSFRKEFFRPEKTHVAQDLDQFVQVGIHLYNIKNPYKELLDSISIDKNSINKTYVEKIAYPYNNLEVYSFYVEAVCQLYSSNHYHLLLHRNDKLPKNLKNNFIFDNFDNFVDWCEFKKFKKFEANHYEEKAHIELANLIYKDLMKKVDIDF